MAWLRASQTAAWWVSWRGAIWTLCTPPRNRQQSSSVLRKTPVPFILLKQIHSCVDDVESRKSWLSCDVSVRPVMLSVYF